MEEAARQIASSGILGAILVVLSWAYYKQGQALEAVHSARVADAQKVAQTLLDLAERWNAALNDLTNAVDRLGERERAPERAPAPRRQS